MLTDLGWLLYCVIKDLPLTTEEYDVSQIIEANYDCDCIPVMLLRGPDRCIKQLKQTCVDGCDTTGSTTDASSETTLLNNSNDTLSSLLQTLQLAIQNQSQQQQVIILKDEDRVKYRLTSESDRMELDKLSAFYLSVIRKITCGNDVDKDKQNIANKYIEQPPFQLLDVDLELLVKIRDEEIDDSNRFIIDLLQRIDTIDPCRFRSNHKNCRMFNWLYDGDNDGIPDRLENNNDDDEECVDTPDDLVVRSNRRNNIYHKQNRNNGCCDLSLTKNEYRKLLVYFFRGYADDVMMYNKHNDEYDNQDNLYVEDYVDKYASRIAKKLLCYCNSNIIMNDKTARNMLEHIKDNEDEPEFANALQLFSDNMIAETDTVASLSTSTKRSKLWKRYYMNNVRLRGNNCISRLDKRVDGGYDTNLRVGDGRVGQDTVSTVKMNGSTGNGNNGSDNVIKISLN
jgi:hypothetical protein